MSYATLQQVKTELGVTGTNDDTLIGDKIVSATIAINTHTNRNFEVQTNTTRNFDSYEDVDGLTLFVDRDLCEINSVTNGDSTTVTAAQYVTEPRNTAPFYAIKLKASKSLSWETDSAGDSEDAIAISGKWGYSKTPPQDIKQACIRLAAYFFRQKDSQVFDVTATPELGQITIPQGMPADVRILLRSYRRA